MAPFLSIEHVSRRFPGVQALSDVSFSVHRGECHALVGENGAGKSTLGRIVAGLLRPDAGSVRMAGRLCRFRSPHDAARAGIACVHQELACCPNLSVAEYLALGRLPARAGFVRRGPLLDNARTLLARLGLSADEAGGRWLDPRQPMERLSPGQVQLVQIAIALGRDAHLLVMDEPTSSLSAAEAARLEAVLAELRRAGVTVLYVSHRLGEIRRNCDRATVLRDGRVIGTYELQTTSTEELVRRMIGRELEVREPPAPHAPGPLRLRVRGLGTRSGVAAASFELRGGEIVGLAGLVGAGRSELARALFGIDPISSGTVEVDGRVVRCRSPRAAIAQGIGLLPEDRKSAGLILSLSCSANLTLAVLRRLGAWGFRRPAAERRLTRAYIERLRIRTPGPDAPIAGLSGGNQQKIALARWLARSCEILILDEPTRGVDVAAKAEIHAWIEQLAAEGRGILLISSELPELLRLATRCLVMRNGRIVGEVSRAAASEELLLRWMTGVGHDPLTPVLDTRAD